MIAASKREPQAAHS